MIKKAHLAVEVVHVDRACCWACAGFNLPVASISPPADSVSTSVVSANSFADTTLVDLFDCVLQEEDQGHA